MSAAGTGGFGAAIVAVALAGCATATHEPANLSPHKREIRAYVARGDYQHDVARVAAQASAWLEQRAARGGARLTVVFDLDDTLFNNWEYLDRVDFGYVNAEWAAWIEAARAPAREPVRDVYRVARRLHVEVVFLTGRPERFRAATERNLRAIDCADYASLICKPPSHQGTSAAFKTAEREKLIRAGCTIIANIGDQESDLVGGFAERTFKVPNPVYLTE